MTHLKKPSLTLSSDGVKELKKQLADLKERRPAMVDRLARARSFGDLSENSEYTNAKEELDFLDRQIQELEAVLQVSKVIKKRKGIADVGSQVSLKSKTKVLSLTLVSHWQADPLKGKISIDSPLGQAIKGHKVNDLINAQTPTGTIKYKLVKIN